MVLPLVTIHPKEKRLSQCNNQQMIEKWSISEDHLDQVLSWEYKWAIRELKLTPNTNGMYTNICVSIIFKIDWERHLSSAELEA